jgi:hypothetical protein
MTRLMNVAPTVTMALLASQVSTGFRARTAVKASSESAESLGSRTGSRERVSSLGNIDVSSIQ